MAAKQRGLGSMPKAGDAVVGRPACSLVMATPTMALSLRLGGGPADPATEAITHAKLIEFVRALAQRTAQTDYAASQKMGKDELLTRTFEP